MPTVKIAKTVDVAHSSRVQQLCGLFDVPPHERSEKTWTCHLPIDAQPWKIGLIYGPSGCGKSTLARELLPAQLARQFNWSPAASIVDDFPSGLGIKQITGLLSAVGFSSPPSWLRPFAHLSNGEQFRVTLARTLAECPELAVVDEFTSVVDRQVAKIGSAAIAKTIRRGTGQFVAVTCHSDIIDWLEPDWVYTPQTDEFQWRCERPEGQWQRPPLNLLIRPVTRATWQRFRAHHYLSANISPAAQCYVGEVDGTPACFVAVVHFPHFSGDCWREHRTVCLPDFQGVGIGNAMSEAIASAWRATGKAYSSTTSHPAMIYHRAKSPLWNMIRKPSMVAAVGKTSTISLRANSRGRNTASFRYVGPQNPDLARRLRII